MTPSMGLNFNSLRQVSYFFYQFSLSLSPSENVKMTSMKQIQNERIIRYVICDAMTIFFFSCISLFILPIWKYTNNLFWLLFVYHFTYFVWICKFRTTTEWCHSNVRVKWMRTLLMLYWTWKYSLFLKKFFSICFLYEITKSKVDKFEAPQISLWTDSLKMLFIQFCSRESKQASIPVAHTKLLVN